METSSRRRFLTLAAGAAGGLGALLGTSGQGLRPELTETFVRPCSPQVRIRYPSGWHLFDRKLVTDLAFPSQLLALASEKVGPHESADGSGDPDLRLFSDRATLIRILAYSVEDARHHHLELHAGIPPVLNLDTFAIEDSHGRFLRYTRLFGGSDFGYRYQVWVGRRANELAGQTIVRETHIE